MLSITEGFMDSVQNGWNATKNHIVQNKMAYGLGAAGLAGLGALAWGTGLLSGNGLESNSGVNGTNNPPTGNDIRTPQQVQAQQVSTQQLNQQYNQSLPKNQQSVDNYHYGQTVSNSAMHNGHIDFGAINNAVTNPITYHTVYSQIRANPNHFLNNPVYASVQGSIRKILGI